jgi:hypothetical protein
MNDPGRPPVSFPVFFSIWAKLQGWVVPELHYRMCQWLELTDARVRVLMVFRGAAKSTIYGVYKAWRLYRDQSVRSQVWAADDKLAFKMTRYTRHVLLTHPLCRGMLDQTAGTQQFWIAGASDMRNPSMAANGILSNATGSRADDVDFDDIEVPKNIRTPEAREAVRTRIAETTHILVPGGRKTFIGTPHTHNSIYEEQIAGGAGVLKIPLFQHSTRHENPGTQKRFAIGFKPAADGITVFLGIGKGARVLVERVDYNVVRGHIVFFKAPGITLDICSDNAWPERFNREEVAFKRRECKTYNEWDSQYQLHAKPLGQVRLDPERLRCYVEEPVVREVNDQIAMFLGAVRIVGASAWWDCSLGKLRSDASALCLVLTDDKGNLYWQLAEGLTGELAEFDAKGELISGQCLQIRNFVIRYQIPAIDVETNGPGGFVPPILRRALKGTGCGVREEFSVVDKRKRILDAFEAPLSTRILWAHRSVIDGPAWDQMKDFNPAVRDQPDDYIDAGAGAITKTPVRIGKVVGTSTASTLKDWRPSSGVHEVTLDMS